MFSLSSVGFCQFCFSTDHHGDLQRISSRMGVCFFFGVNKRWWWCGVVVLCCVVLCCVVLCCVVLCCVVLCCVVLCCVVLCCVVLCCGGVCCKLRNKCLSRVRTQPVLCLFVHPCKTWTKKNWHITSSLPTVTCTWSSHTQQHTTKHNNTHTQQHTTHTNTHNKAQLHHAGLIPNGIVSFMTPSAPFETSKKSELTN